LLDVSGCERQKLSKAALALSNSANPAERSSAAWLRHAARSELAQVVQLWSSSHKGLLQGDALVGLTGTNSAEVMRMF